MRSAPALNAASLAGHLDVNGHVVDVARVLLENRANANQVTWRKDSPLCVACIGGYFKIVNLAGCDGATALALASQEYHVSIVQLLLSRGADSNRFDEGNNHLAVAGILLENGSGVNRKTGGFSPSYIASQKGNLAIARFLIENNGANVDDEIEGCTPSSVACERGHERSDFERLLFALLARRDGYLLDVVGLLLSKRANPNASDNGFSALMIASMAGHDPVVRLFLSNNNADVDGTDLDGSTSLYLASQYGHVAVATLLIDHGADVNSARNDGATPSRHRKPEGAFGGR
ncbi:hypothetical protein CTAYLR_000809 [Chrysophaeum taylorii]|uniref:Ankyrin repeat protein n=1 Tax=Chrysophaeum taylorii TaxID=2483200 RepID=A0AAD7UPY3_9STRA|nr:hypothetical protein CTAYLR_000809 [Chrysophaeum taylorii]